MSLGGGCECSRSRRAAAGGARTPGRTDSHPGGPGTKEDGGGAGVSPARGLLVPAPHPTAPSLAPFTHIPFLLVPCTPPCSLGLALFAASLLSAPTRSTTCSLPSLYPPDRGFRPPLISGSLSPLPSNFPSTISLSQVSPACPRGLPGSRSSTVSVSACLAPSSPLPHPHQDAGQRPHFPPLTGQTHSLRTVTAAPARPGASPWPPSFATSGLCLSLGHSNTTRPKLGPGPQPPPPLDSPRPLVLSFQGLAGSRWHLPRLTRKPAPTRRRRRRSPPGLPRLVLPPSSAPPRPLPAPGVLPASRSPPLRTG